MARMRQSPTRRLALAVGILALAVITTAEAIPLESWDQRITTPNRFEPTSSRRSPASVFEAKSFFACAAPNA